MNSVIRVNIPQKSYDIAISKRLEGGTAKHSQESESPAGGLDDLGVWLSRLKLGKKVLVVSNPAIFSTIRGKSDRSFEVSRI